MQCTIRFNEEQLSFLLNNLEPSCDFPHGDPTKELWYLLLLARCWDEDEQQFHPEIPIRLGYKSRQIFLRNMEEDADIIFKQLRGDVMYHACNSSSWNNSIWCLEMISDIINIIKNSSFEED